MALNNLEPRIVETAATLTCDPLPTVLADPAQLTQIFEILIGNAIKFRGAEPPVVHISARQTFEVSETSKVSAPVWEFAVHDNGIGIEPQYFERIFIIFQRLHTRRKYQGSASVWQSANASSSGTAAGFGSNHSQSRGARSILR